MRARVRIDREGAIGIGERVRKLPFALQNDAAPPQGLAELRGTSAALDQRCAASERLVLGAGATIGPIVRDGCGAKHDARASRQQGGAAGLSCFPDWI